MTLCYILPMAENLHKYTLREFLEKVKHVVE